MSPQEFYPWSSFNHCFPCRLVVAVRPIKKGDLWDIVKLLHQPILCCTIQHSFQYLDLGWYLPWHIPDLHVIMEWTIQYLTGFGSAQHLLCWCTSYMKCVSFDIQTIPYFQVVGRFQMLAVHLGFHLWFLVAAAKSLAFQGAVFSNAVFAAKTFATASCPVTYSGEDTWWGSAVGWGTAGDIPAKFGWRFPQWQIFHDFFLEHLVFFFIRN